MPRRTGRNVNRTWRPFGALLTATLCVLALLPGPAVAAAQWQVAVGAQSQDEAVQANAFLTNDLGVDVGDTVTWTVRTGEFHTVTFLSGLPEPPLIVLGPGGPAFNPLAAGPVGGPSYDGTGYTNSGFLVEGQTFSLSFTRTGDFPYLCLIHTGMAGTVHVAPAGTAYPHTQTFYDAQAQSQGAQLVGQGRALQAQGLVAAVQAGAGQDTAGIGQLLPGTGSLFIARFLPEHRVIHVGQTVAWTNRDPEAPHTITFGQEPPGGPLGAFAPSGIDAPGHATLIAPGQSVNSGFIGAGLPFGTTFSATFTAPGTYTYICALHDDLGMTGVIDVVP